MPVYILKNEMPYDELLNWIEYFKRRPVGWREDQRAYMFLRTQGVKESAEKLFPTLDMIKRNSIKLDKPDQAKPKGKFLELMKKARDGDANSIFNEV